MSIDVILFVCIYICGIIIVFDLLYSIGVWNNRRLKPRFEEFVTAKLNEQVNQINKNEQQHRNLLHASLGNRLTNENWLLAFAEVYNEDYRASLPEKTRGKLQIYIVEMLTNLVTQYQSLKEDKQAFLAYIIYDTVPTMSSWQGKPEILDHLVRQLATYMHSKSFYVRINAFRALVRIGSTEYIFYALTTINDYLQLRNTKFFSDYLTEMREDNTNLLNLLFENMHNFSPQLQILTIHYLRLLADSEAHHRHNPDVFKIMCNPKTNKETVIAAIMYFGRHYYEPASNALQEFLQTSLEDVAGFNLAAVAARSLQMYPSITTEKLLIKHLGNSNWHVRLNCADSLLALGFDYREIMDNHSDPYARQMILHRHEAAILREGGGL